MMTYGDCDDDSQLTSCQQATYVATRERETFKILKYPSIFLSRVSMLKHAERDIVMANPSDCPMPVLCLKMDVSSHFFTF